LDAAAPLSSRRALRRQNSESKGVKAMTKNGLMDWNLPGVARFVALE
jgi:hypothetical protein